MTLYPHQKKFLDQNPDYAILCFETGCLHPETKITDAITGESNTIKQWSELERGFFVKVYDKSSRKFVFARANPPVRYEKSHFLNFYLAGGDVISVTPQHRFLVSTTQGGIWKTAEELYCDYLARQLSLARWPKFLRPFASFLFPRMTIVGRGLSWLPQGVQRWMSKVEDYLYRYSNRYHQYGPQLHQVSGSVQGVLPSQGDALELYSVCSDEGGRENKLNDNWYIHPFSQQPHLLSKKHYWVHYDNNSAFDPVRPFFLSGSGQFGNRHRIYRQFVGTLDQIRTTLSTFLYRVFYSLNNNSKNVKVWKVGRLKTQDVYYDFHVPHYENYVLAGVVNHNCGKTFTADLWLERDNRLQNAVIICPKQIRGDWKDTVPTATVYSFEDFLKADLPNNPTAIVVDEADAMASPLFVAKLRSKRTEKLYNYVMSNPSTHILLLTATPVRSTPWNMHTLLVLSRIKSPNTWKKYRSLYFELQHKPFLPRPAYFPKIGWQRMMQELIDEYTHTALMGDIVELPPETHEIIKLKQPNYEENEEWEPMAQFVADHRLEQLQKGKEIKRISKGYRKVVVVAHFRQQIGELQKELSRERETFVLDGRTGDPQQVVADAEASPECYLIIQSSVGAGFELPSFAVMIFASQGYSVRNYIQMCGRIKRINTLKPTYYYYLQSGRCDRMIYNSIKKGEDFIPSKYKQYETT